MAGVAAIGAFGLTRLGGATAGESDAIRVVDGAVTIPGFVPGAGEVAAWQAAVGTTMAIAAVGVATIAAVTPLPVRSRLPAGVRQVPFFVHFSVEHRNMPARDGIFDIGTPIDGLSRVFLSRGEDRFGKGSLIALFA